MYVFGDPNTTGLFGRSGNMVEQRLTLFQSFSAQRDLSTNTDMRKPFLKVETIEINYFLQILM